MMSYWTFSDVFEEQGVVKEPFYGGFGLVAEGGLPKPSFNAFKLLHKLAVKGFRSIRTMALVTRRVGWNFVIALWNLFLPDQHGESKEVEISIEGLTGKPSGDDLTRRFHSRLAFAAFTPWAVRKAQPWRRLNGYAKQRRLALRSLRISKAAIVSPPQGLA